SGILSPRRTATARRYSDYRSVVGGRAAHSIAAPTPDHPSPPTRRTLGSEAVSYHSFRCDYRLRGGPDLLAPPPAERSRRPLLLSLMGTVGRRCHGAGPAADHSQNGRVASIHYCHWSWRVCGSRVGGVHRSHVQGSISRIDLRTSPSII